MINSDFSLPRTANTDLFTDVNSLEKIKYDENKDEALKKVSEQFESLFVHMMLKSMRSANAVFEEGNMLTSKEGTFFRDMYDQQMSVNMSSGRGIGIADALYRQLKGVAGVEQAEEPKLSADMHSLENTARKVFGEISPAEKIKLQSIVNEIDEIEIGDSKSLDKYLDSNPSVDENRKPLASSPEEFIEKIMPFAEKAAQKLGVDKSVLIAQSALETGWGRYVLADPQGNTSNNLFNIKANSDWQGERVQVSSLEYQHGQFSQVSSPFKKYQNIEQSFNDYAELILSKPRYQDAVNAAGDSRNYIEKISEAGYATDPKYADKVQRIYDQITENTFTSSVKGDKT